MADVGQFAIDPLLLGGQSAKDGDVRVRHRRAGHAGGELQRRFGHGHHGHPTGQRTAGAVRQRTGQDRRHAHHGRRHPRRRFIRRPGPYFSFNSLHLHSRSTFLKKLEIIYCSSI